MTKPRRPSLKELTANASANASAGACGVPSFDGVAFAEGAAGYKQALREAVPPVKLAQLMATLADQATRGDKAATKALTELIRVLSQLPADITSSATSLTVNFTTATTEQLDAIRKEHGHG